MTLFTLIYKLKASNNSRIKTLKNLNKADLSDWTAWITYKQGTYKIINQ